jgi:predicted DCC family thiol-disulfide oxidoreductase YuxK
MPKQQFKLLYDGDCPFCRREVEWLKRCDRNDKLALEDIAALGFDPARYGLTREEVMGSLHGILPDGRVVSRVEAIRQAYRAVGLGWLVAATRLPIIRGVLDGMYGLFARNRIRLGRLFGRQCESDACVVQAPLSRKSKATRPHGSCRIMPLSPATRLPATLARQEGPHCDKGMARGSDH